MKWIKWAGIVSALLLIISCYMPWAYYPDLDEFFSGFYSQKGILGRPGVLITVLAAMNIILHIIPRIWAKRVAVFIGAILFAYSFRSFFVFTGCYGGICPEKQPGIWIMVFSSFAVMISTFFPDIKPGRGKRIN